MWNHVGLPRWLTPWRHRTRRQASMERPWPPTTQGRGPRPRGGSLWEPKHGWFWMESPIEIDDVYWFVLICIDLYWFVGTPIALIDFGPAKKGRKLRRSSPLSRDEAIDGKRLAICGRTSHARAPCWVPWFGNRERGGPWGRHHVSHLPRKSGKDHTLQCHKTVYRCVESCSKMNWI